MRGLPPRGSIPFRATQRSLRFAKENWSGRSSTRAPVLRVSAPEPWLVSRSRRFRRARLSPDFAFSAWKAACRLCRLLSLRSSRGSGLTQRRQRSPRCLSRSVKPRSDRPPAKAPLIDRIGRFADLMASETDVSLFAALRDAEGTGRPLGSDELVKELERLTGRRLHRQKPVLHQ